MKKIISLLIAALVVSAGNACIKKDERVRGLEIRGLEVSAGALSIIVMDTTQALLDGAQVKVGKKIYTTSWDGRVVLKPEQVNGVKSISVSCEGYKDKTVALSGERTQIVALVGKKSRGKGLEDERIRGLEGKGARLTGMRSADVLYATSATADYAMPKAAAVTEEMHTLPYYGESANSNVSAGKLTAGEVNDFTKWALWDKYQQSAAAYQKIWRLTPRERYTVQVTNKNGYPIPNYPVNLTDANGNTLFQAVTDNTGKAELWGDKRMRGLEVRGLEDKRFPAKAGAINTIELDEECDYTDDVDVLFVFDATGSMGDELRYLQAEMKDVIARAKDATGGLNIRTGAVVYRDHSDEYVARISRLTEDIATTQTFIDKQSASGGGDYPEAVPEALMAALNSAGWNESSRARVLFLILDAPCHEDSATVALLHEQVLNAAAMGVRIVPVVCSGLGESGEYLLRSIALTTNGTSFFLTDDSGIGNPHLKPNTDSLKVEHLNDMLVRTIVEFSYMPDCARGKWHYDEIEHIQEEFIPNPFNANELTEEERIAKDSRTTLYLLDVSGKLIYVYNGVLEEAGDRQLSSLGVMLSTGVYFVKAFYDGEWHVKKILVH